MCEAIHERRGAGQDRVVVEVVDPIVGIRCEPDLTNPRPQRLRRCVHGNSAPRLQSWRVDEVIAWIVPGDFVVRYVPTIADHWPSRYRLTGCSLLAFGWARVSAEQFLGMVGMVDFWWVGAVSPTQSSAVSGQPW